MVLEQLKMSKLFAVIVAYKGQQWYDRCFKSLRESTIPVQTIVVDNASNDGTVEYIKECYPEIHLIESKENLGFGRANNLAMRYALDHSCDYVFLLNQDAWVESDAIEKLIAVHKSHPEYGILSPMHLNAEKDKIEKGLIRYLDDKSVTDKTLFEDLYFGRLKEVYRTNYVNAAAWLLPRKTLETVGGFDPIFLHYGEDDNYMHRVLYHKMRIGICPLCRVVHDTERRIQIGTQKVMTENRNLLADVTNINASLNLNALRWFHFRKSVSKFLTNKKPQAQKHWDKFRYLGKNKKSILRSRAQNVVVGPSWL